ncbi:rho GTPase-activating protein 44-like isoform X2 [Phymastichus coffea]|uniref:rho GTPase-activating protein 44-like isoform X2 n=1 Tax=Phymastichus coffea TaxID=108790 RepID=UPI00273ABEF9|nr:rho GTPase-activating protein 44-like isoform X2 [Phymastichus coffea]
MKKQFFRVKQLADQTFSRAGKTEVLTDDLQAADKHVEQIRAALMGLNKRLGKPSESSMQDSAHKEKRLKKSPEYVLGQTMLENAGEEGLMCYTLTECGKAQIALANEAVDHEAKVEQYVSVPLQNILETDVPNILKYKRNLQRLILDMDSTRTRYQQASKHNTGGTAATKVDSLRDELEEAETKVEQCRDLLAAEMFQLMSKETELAQTIIQYVKLQRAYHESALHCLEDLIPELECYINDNETKPVYGYSLEEHLRVTNRKIALPIQLCVCALLRLGMEEEGLFRIASGASKLRRMKLSFDACCISLPVALEYKDPHVIAGALKSYLRELSEPLLTFKLYPEWMAAAKLVKSDDRLRALWEVLHKLPTANYENLRFLIKFFAVLTKNQDVNKMTPHNIAIVVAPNLIWNSQEDITTVVMDTANNSSLIVEQMITYADWFFPGEIDFDRELDLGGIVNGSEPTPTVGMRRCVSNSSLSDHGESPTQGSPKPATRRKNKPAPTPPSGNTPDKHITQVHHENRRPDDKPPPAPDKPPRPLTTSTLNRATYKSQKHDQVTAELIQLRNQDNAANSKAMQHSNKLATHAGSKAVENDAKPMGFELVDKAELIKDQNSTDALQLPENSPTHKNENQPRDSEEEGMNANLIGFEALNLKPNLGTGDMTKSVNESMIMMDNTDKLDSPKLKPVPAEKPSQSTLERRKFPVAAPRNLILTSNQQDDVVEMRRKPEGTCVTSIDRNSKPAIPERPAGLARPSSLIRPHPRHSNENLDADSGPLTLERIHMYSVDKQQRSPSVGSRPVSMSLSHGSMTMQPPEKPPRPEHLPDPIKSHSRTRSEGNIIDVQTQTNTVIVPKSQQQQVPPASPRFHQRPPRPQPPPPPPPTGAKPKSDHESTNL